MGLTNKRIRGIVGYFLIDDSLMHDSRQNLHSPLKK